MAERRMFAKTILDSDAFIDLPLSVQALYIHLAMQADDDGFIQNPKRIQRMLGCSDEDVQQLFQKNFIIPFQSGVIVIRHWRVHNYIKKDRYKETMCQKEKAALHCEKNGTYVLVDEFATSMVTDCPPDGSSGDTQVRLGEIRQGKDKDKHLRSGGSAGKPLESSGETADSPSTTRTDQHFEEFWQAYPKKRSKNAARKAWQKLKPDATLHQRMLTVLEAAKKSHDWTKERGKFIPYPATWLNAGGWEDEMEVQTHDKQPSFHIDSIRL